MAVFDMIDALRDSGLTSILPIPLRVPARPGWDSCSWPGLGQVALWFTPRLGRSFALPEDKNFCAFCRRSSG
uniref:Uncharacterized protein n=1 Tax=Candidatus Kentrum sp. FM TaxID=2126340 RepID=A0A450VTH1_9GAMM|nr:MAG: hypothetical protein BECKFM1743C_GA0114222_100594 [Candidatus Kentron sp. FM]VFJ77135.1 MAG: hypothetical protein BECKFM1743A_GA0114220_109634 [Candidatus Kentron sp. FM]VFK08083.1 MAG: hypothetical protein BECKFM1743B_GA0114221_100594 [Candidatus Kentron sp. FM]